jgi:enoyl-CoA hydratase/carnithine racemase
VADLEFTVEDGIGTILLNRRAKALELPLTGDVVDAVEAERLGAVTDDAEEALAAARERRDPTFTGK